MGTIHPLTDEGGGAAGDDDLRSREILGNWHVCWFCCPTLGLGGWGFLTGFDPSVF
ncbi:hypothetical protein LC607_36050 [Nostoc sp. CHAB 5824]|nr:hypothetical protein [Nostoc sp. CHAB 5824]